MLNIESKIPFKESVWLEQNLTHYFSEEEQKSIAGEVYRTFRSDLQSRSKWEKRSQAALDLALQLVEAKNFPWPHCSNINFPLVTIAALQFHARAYPALVQTPSLVKCHSNLPDTDGSLRKVTDLLSRHMSWQLLEQNKTWESQHDQMLFNLAIIGCAFKKTYFQEYNHSELVMAQDLIVDYWAKSLETAQRITHRIRMSSNEIFSEVRRGNFRDVTQENWFLNGPDLEDSILVNDKRQGISPPLSGDSATTYTILEQHLNIDLDGDGYEEPYIITIEEKSKALLRIVTRWEFPLDVERNYKGELIAIHPTHYFTKYTFIPSPDGGFYDVGFGTLLGPLNESANTIINQLTDAGTLANTQGGFLGRGVKIRGGNMSFSPAEWKTVDSTGDDLHKGIYPLPVKEPSKVLFELLQLIINYTGRISGATDTLVGENPGQNTPAQTQQSMVEQGLKIYSAIYKRVWKGMQEEFQKIFRLNTIYLSSVAEWGEQQSMVIRDLYKQMKLTVNPQADPYVVSEREGIQKTQILKQIAATTPGYNLEEVERRFLSALKVESPESVYPGPKKVAPPPNPKVQIEQLRAQIKSQDSQQKTKLGIMKLMNDHELNQAKIKQLLAQAQNELAQAQGVGTGHKIAALDSAIGLMKHQDEQFMNRLNFMLSALDKEQENDSDPNSNSNTGGVSSMGAKPSDRASNGLPDAAGD